jgi:NTP pyrophosphatase (non-canonical NTP hydrolase)
MTNQNIISESKKSDPCAVALKNLRNSIENRENEPQKKLNPKIDSQTYIEFVENITSEPSSNTEVLIDRIRELDAAGVKLPQLLTFTLGMIGELGETVDLLKKCIFQGKEYTSEVEKKLLLEAGDVCFYMVQFCVAMGVNFEDLMQLNYEKLSARYPEGHFTIHRSENRKEGDI